ncbi:hypothetical protein NQ315_007849 [Exocentrus adspersus]|uniref:PBZ-type domain-containing protein n=1 Tax=Exocentrus adspersus TaxID=1586481 RepID=A0AAV8W8S8_9CUCU|nr:hypothetical protein NQ315_007849 [Exocentrus adspersus]
MEAFLKRKNDENPVKTSKKAKIELCPHSDRCYRKNPHHFREYDHPHLKKFIEMGDSMVIPDGLPQPKNVYLEQIQILKSMNNQIVEAKQQGATQSGGVKSMPDLSCQAGPSSSRISNKGTVTSYSSSNTSNRTEEIFKSRSKPGTMLENLERAAPYNFFFSTVNKAPETQTQPNAITFTDLLCPSLGELKRSLQINFMIDIDWLLKQYKARNLHTKPLTIIYGDDWPDMPQFIDMFCPNVTYKFIKMPDLFGCHHSKIGVYVYADNSLRVVVSTANLYYEDWNHYNQGWVNSVEFAFVWCIYETVCRLWLSPACPRLPESSPDTEGESPTGFKSTLLEYLGSYNLSCLNDFINYVKRADFSAVRVFLICSIPGKRHSNEPGCHLLQVGHLLHEHCALPAKTTPQSEGPLSWGIIAQASSIGSMGKKPADWLRGALLRSLASHTRSLLPMTSNASLSIVYPSVDNVMTVNGKQKRTVGQGRCPTSSPTAGFPPCMTKLAYFLLTSANLSKSAWGASIGKDSKVYMRSYEAGVLFLPKLFDEEYFEIQRTPTSKNKNLFPFMYDLPLVPYKADDYPWCN